MAPKASRDDEQLDLAENADPLIEEPIDFGVLEKTIVLRYLIPLPALPEDEYPAGSGPYGF